jgi:nitrogen regulatory protein P-II 1
VKKIEAIIRPHKLEDVKSALGDKISGMSIMEMRGFGRQRGHSEVYRGAEYKIDFVPKIRLEIICKNEDAETLIGIIADSARTGKVGDGKIFISDIADAVRIRTGERGEVCI